MCCSRLTPAGLRSAIALSVLALVTGPARAVLTDFETWTLVQDPAHPNLSGAVTASQVTLSAAGGPIPAGTDIGYQSVKGPAVGSSGSGYFFSPSADFSLAIDFSVSFGDSPSGSLGIGFGIGEDSDGMNSVGLGLLFNNNIPLGFFGAARVDDVTQAPAPIFVSASATGSMFVRYQAATGNVTLGASRTQGAAAPTATATFNGIQNRWDDAGLLVSLFLRSDGTLGTPWQGGSAAARFSDLRVLSGTPIAAPAPAPLALVGLGLGWLVVRRGRARAGAAPVADLNMQ